jgi:hypothetical protein
MRLQLRGEMRSEEVDESVGVSFGKGEVNAFPRPSTRVVGIVIRAQRRNG